MNEPVSVPKPAIPRSSRQRAALVGLILGALLAAGAIGLDAQQKGSTASSLQPSCLTPLVASESSTSAAEAQALLPTIPAVPPSPLPAAMLAPGVLSGSQTPLTATQNTPTVGADDLKNLYGYSGPYYNTTDLDGRVVVLNQSVYTWPTATWKTTGLVRNQTRCPLHITSVTALLKGADGRTLATATASLPISDLRPGEPGPFIVVAPVSPSDVSSISWQVSYAPAIGVTRLFRTAVYSEYADETGYHITGALFNDATTSAQVELVGAWLNSQGQVFYVANLPFITGDPNAETEQLEYTTSLQPNQLAAFAYTNPQGTLAQGLLKAPQGALWEVSK